MFDILVADDHPLYLDAVCGMLNRAFPEAAIHPFTTAGDTLAAVDRLPEGDLELVLLDLHMPGMAGGQTIKVIQDRAPNARIIIMSGLATLSDVQRALALGAKGFLPKTMRSDLFIEAVSLVRHGGTYIPAELLSGALPPTDFGDHQPSLTENSDISTLSERELSVLRMLPAGLMNKEIARELGLAEMTVKLHVRQILRKLGAKNRAEAAAIAQKAGL